MSCNLYLVSGNDEARIASHANDIIQKILGDDGDDFNYEVIQLSDDNNYQQMLLSCLESLQTFSLLGNKTIWLKNFPFDREPKAMDKDSYAKQFNQLLELLDNLEGINFIMSGLGINRARRLYKVVHKLGEVILFDKIDMKQRDWQKQVGQQITLVADKKNLKIPPQTKEFLIEVIGVDIKRIEVELEKLACYFVTKPLTLAEVQDLCSGGKQTAFWSLTNALGKRDLSNCIDVINRFLINSKNDKSACLGLLSNVGSFFDKLLHCRLLMQGLSVKSPSQVEKLLEKLSEEQIIEKFAENSVIKLHPYRLKMLCQDAMTFSGKHLLKIHQLITESSRSLISTQTSPRLILENLCTHIIIG